MNPHRPIAGLNLGLNTDEAASVILNNRQSLLNELNANNDDIAYAVQVHETRVEEVQKGDVYSDTDAFVTNKKGLNLAIQVADCAAVLFGDAKHGVIGAAHAGWRGAVAGIIPKTVQRMRDLGAEPAHIQVFVSPCISLKNFEVGDEVAAKFPEQFVDRTNYAKAHVDLKGFIKHELQRAGILDDHIVIDPHCTIEDPSFYSHRRQQQKSGRMMGIIKLN